MAKDIIPIKEASAELKEALVKMGILERTKEGYTISEFRQSIAI